MRLTLLVSRLCGILYGTAHHQSLFREKRGMHELVAQNLVHHQLWSRVELVSTGAAPVLRGLPPKKLFNTDDETRLEYVVCGLVEQNWTVEKFSKVFDQIKELQEFGTPPERVFLGLRSADSTVVYYLVKSGFSG